MYRNWGMCPFFERGAGFPSSTMWSGPRLISMPSAILIHPAVSPQVMSRKLEGALSPFGQGGAGFPSNTMSLGLKPTSLPSGILIHPAIWSQQISAENWGGGCAPLGEGSWVPISHNLWPGPRPTCMPSFDHLDPSNRLTTIHQRYRIQTDRQDRQRSGNIGRTVLRKCKPGHFVKRL